MKRLLILASALLLAGCGTFRSEMAYAMESSAEVKILAKSWEVEVVNEGKPMLRIREGGKDVGVLPAGGRKLLWGEGDTVIRADVEGIEAGAAMRVIFALKGNTVCAEWR